VVLIVTLGFGGIGWYDDWRKVVIAIRAGCRRAGSISGSRRSACWRRSTSA
jgi:UDP-N-acetylmuramyl pentapeptide phosphotransferase/UDP-N-acetylglucosamine-1-phosphate transferase